MGRWFRMYDDVLDDPKAQKLSDAAFRGWVNILCLASKSGGMLEQPLGNVAFSLRKSVPKTHELLQVLISAGLLESVENGWKPHNWDARQFKSDVSTERVKRFRKRHETVTATAPESDTESEQRHIKKKPPAASLVGFVLPPWVPETAWAGYLELRKSKRAPNSDHAKNLVIKNLNKLRLEGEDPGAVLDQSVTRGWTGLFPTKGNGGRNVRQPTAHENFAAGALAAAMENGS